MKNNIINIFMAVFLSALLIMSIIPLSAFADSNFSDDMVEHAKGLIIDDSVELTVDPLPSSGLYSLNPDYVKYLQDVEKLYYEKQPVTNG